MVRLLIFISFFIPYSKIAFSKEIPIDFKKKENPLVLYSEDDLEDPLSLSQYSFHPMEWKIWGSGNYWIKIPNSFGPSSVLELEYPLVERGELFALGDNGMVEKSSFGIENLSSGNNNRLYTYAFKTNQNAKVYLLHIRSAWVRMPINIRSSEEFASENRIKVMAISFALGVLFVIYLLQFNLYLFRNERIYLWFSLLVLADLVFLSIETGFIFWLVANGIPGWNNRILPISICLHFIILGINILLLPLNKQKFEWLVTITMLGIPWLLLFSTALIETALLYPFCICGNIFYIIILFVLLNRKKQTEQVGLFPINIYLGIWTLYLLNLWLGVIPGFPWLLFAGLLLTLFLWVLVNSGYFSNSKKISISRIENLTISILNKIEVPELTIRENEVFGLLIEGKSNQEISEILDISLSTVKSFVSNIYGKLNIKSRSEAIFKYKNEG